ncbi:MAG TPA: cytidylate kinase-like family protein [Candidatus Deferrimicrobium sp.]|nr:cytidylate kinase-like family protein [Candidatus Deferrimicrobium sp.]
MTSIDAIVNRQLLKWEMERQKAAEQKLAPPEVPRIVTVSRQLGSRGSYFAEKLAERLGYQHLHREIIDTICQSTGYRKRIIESLDEKFRGQLDRLVESLFTGQAVDYREYHRYLFRTVLSLSLLGGVVLLGRGGNFILGPNRGFHMRFVAPRDQRIRNLVKYRQLSEADAARQIEASDTERREFVAKLFHADIDDSRHYDIVINTAYIDVESLLDTTVKLIEAKFAKLASTDS